jgi:hypothetical protein
LSVSRRAIRSSRAAIAWSRSASTSVLAAAAPASLLEAGGVAPRARQLTVGQAQAFEHIFSSLCLWRAAPPTSSRRSSAALAARFGLRQLRAQAIGLVARRDDLGGRARAAAYRP